MSILSQMKIEYACYHILFLLGNKEYLKLWEKFRNISISEYKKLYKVSVRFPVIFLLLYWKCQNYITKYLYMCNFLVVHLLSAPLFAMEFNFCCNVKFDWCRKLVSSEFAHQRFFSTVLELWWYWCHLIFQFCCIGNVTIYHYQLCGEIKWMHLKALWHHDICSKYELNVKFELRFK